MHIYNPSKIKTFINVHNLNFDQIKKNPHPLYDDKMGLDFHT